MKSSITSRIPTPEAPDLRTHALAGVSWLLGEQEAVGPTATEWDFLREATAGVGRPWWNSAWSVLARPSAVDRPLARLAASLGLHATETLAVALAAAVEDDPRVGRILAAAQAPLGSSRPTIALLAEAFAPMAEPGERPLDRIAHGRAAGAGLLLVSEGSAPLPERTVSVPAPVCRVLLGLSADWPDITIGGSPVPIPGSFVAEAVRQAGALRLAEPPVLTIRARSIGEARSAGAAVALALGRRLATIGPKADLRGLAPWLLARGLIPAFLLDLAPGDRREIPRPPGYSGPVLALCGPDGSALWGGEGAPSWTLPVPSAAERRALWSIALGPGALADHLASQYRHGTGRVAHLGRQARRLAIASGRVEPTACDVLAAARTTEGAELEALAEPLDEEVPDNALVVPPGVQQALAALLVRCKRREGLAEGLGPAARARGAPGVRALFLGPPGTGKTLAAGWLAGRLGLPLFRVDLAAVLSKYIGDVEKNLSKLMAHVEHAEIVLLFDEADALFARRTDVRDANDRHANSQTNYLLQRIESFDGIALLTSNSRARFDPAFSRRLDQVIEFPAPGPEERRGLWLAHLGERHAIEALRLNRLSAVPDITGGQIRGAVLHAQAMAREAGRAIAYLDLLAGLSYEYAKVGQPVPSDLERERAEAEGA